MKFIVTGDTHGHTFSRLARLDNIDFPPTKTALIVLGDAGFNFYLNDTDSHNKQKVNQLGYRVYCVRGNHEERPENIYTMTIVYDDEIKGAVYLEPAYPNIRYLMDGGVYEFEGHPTLVVGGAYSVDKWYRLSTAPCETGWTGWFVDEQLTEKEMDYIMQSTAGRSFDFVLTHTCPYFWQPRDLFIKSLNQASVDKTMELWMEKLKDNFNWKIWLFGHFHDDRLMRPGVEMFYNDWDSLENIWRRWTEPEGKVIIDTLVKDPRFDQGR